VGVGVSVGTAVGVSVGVAGSVGSEVAVSVGAGWVAVPQAESANANAKTSQASFFIQKFSSGKDFRGFFAVKTAKTIIPHSRYPDILDVWETEKVSMGVAIVEHSRLH
jgi:hypothetical protein